MVDYLVMVLFVGYYLLWGGIVGIRLGWVDFCEKWGYVVYIMVLCCIWCLWYIWKDKLNGCVLYFMGDGREMCFMLLIY